MIGIGPGRATTRAVPEPTDRAPGRHDVYSDIETTHISPVGPIRVPYPGKRYTVIRVNRGTHANSNAQAPDEGRLRQDSTCVPPGAWCG